MRESKPQVINCGNCKNWEPPAAPKDIWGECNRDDSAEGTLMVLADGGAILTQREFYCSHHKEK